MIEDVWVMKFFVFVLQQTHEFITIETVQQSKPFFAKEVLHWGKRGLNDDNNKDENSNVT